MLRYVVITFFRRFSAAKVSIIYDLRFTKRQNNVRKKVKNACQFTEKQYLCKPIIIRESYKGLTICVLIAFLMAWEGG